MLPRIALFAFGLAAAVPTAASAQWDSNAYGSSSSTSTPAWQGLFVGAHVGAGFGKAAEQRSSGALAGLGAGYNWQADRVVAGVEADISFSDVAAKSAGDVYRQDWLASIRGRVGMTFGNLLAYGTAGPSFVGTGWRSNNGKKEETVTGWVAGVGAELYLTRAFSVKGEFLHYGLSEENYPTSTGTRSVDPTSNVLRGGVNYRF